MPDSNQNNQNNQTITYIDLSGLGVYTDEVKKLIRQIVTQMDDPEIVVRSTYQDFPALGDASHIYIDTGNNAVYRWNENDLHYYCVGRDYSSINLINANWD